MQNKESGTVYAGFFVRLAAFIVDSLIVGIALTVIKIPVWFASFGTDTILTRDFIFQYSALDIVYYILKVCYFALLTYFTGATLGKRLFHLRVVSSEEGKLSFFDIVFRESVGKFLSKLIIFIGYIMVGADKKKRGLHDILSDTCVVYEHKITVAVPTPVLAQQIPFAVPPQPMQGQNQFFDTAQSRYTNAGQQPFASQNTVQNQYTNAGQQPFTSQNTVQNQYTNAGQQPIAPQNTAHNAAVPDNSLQNQNVSDDVQQDAVKNNNTENNE